MFIIRKEILCVYKENNLINQKKVKFYEVRFLTWVAWITLYTWLVTSLGVQLGFTAFII